MSSRADSASAPASCGRAAHQRDVQLLEAREKEREVAERRAVRPVCVVDDDAERPRRGEVRTQPVEPVQDRERGVGLCRDPDRRPGARPGTREGRRGTGRGLQEVRPLELGCLGEGRLEDLAYHAECEVAFQLRTARPQHAHPAAGGDGPDRGQQRRLADARGPLDHHERAASGARIGERRLDPRELLAPLEQDKVGAGGPSHTGRA